jgi:quercetin dioxygenase-like cupin family protein
MAPTSRRFVTGHDAAGKSVFILKETQPVTRTVGSGGTQVTELWETRSTPADNSGNADAAEREFRLPPPAHGSVFRIVQYPPDATRIGVLRALDTHDDSGEGYTRDFAHARHPGFHKTSTTDYAIVLNGEIYALMDEGEELMRAGDVLVQRGTNHAWSNRTNETVHIAFVLIDALPEPSVP